MCRILAIQAHEPFDPDPWIAEFAERCRLSTEYQGHGWGAAWRTAGGWSQERVLDPIWTEGRARVPSSRVVIVHARSAFQNEGIAVHNNMPFVRDDLAFAFNGELRGVRLSVPGETGAARLHELVERFRADGTTDIPTALRRLDQVIARRSDHVRAMNLVVGDAQDVFVHSRFAGEPDYFTMHRTVVPDLGGGAVVVSSERFTVPGRDIAWEPIANGSTFGLGEVDTLRERGVPC